VITDSARASQITVTTRFPRGADRDWKAQGAGYWRNPEDDGTFLFEGLRGGTFDVVVEVRDSDLFIPVAVTGVMVRPGEITRDPRLQKVELREKGKLVYLTVVDVEGRPITSAEAADMSDPATGAQAHGSVVRGRDGRIRMILPNAPSDVVVGASGYRRTVAPSVDSDREVVLVKGLAVKVLVTGDALAGLPEGASLRATLTFSDAAGNRSKVRPADLPGRSSGAVLDASTSSGTILVADPGRYRLSVVLAASRGKQKVAQEIASDWVNVTDSGSSQVFEVAARQKDVDKVLKMLESK
jgi:hypothetical protein